MAPVHAVTCIQSIKSNLYWDSGCGTGGRAVASYSRGPGLEIIHRQILKEHLFLFNCIIERAKVKKEAVIHLNKNWFMFSYGWVNIS